MTGSTLSEDFPTRNQYQTDQPERDAFVAKLNTNGSGNASLLYSTYLGGGSRDEGSDIAVDVAGNAYVTGWTRSDNFPTTPNAYQIGDQAGDDAFLLKLADSTSSLTLNEHQKDQSGTDSFVKLNTQALGDVLLLYSSYLGGPDQGEPTPTPTPEPTPTPTPTPEPTPTPTPTPTPSPTPDDDDDDDDDDHRGARLITRTTFRCDGSNLIATITITNRGKATANNVVLNVVRLRHPVRNGQNLPQNYGTIAPGESVSRDINFGSGNPSGRRQLRTSGTFTKGRRQHRRSFGRTHLVTVPACSTAAMTLPSHNFLGRPVISGKLQQLPPYVDS